MNERATIDVRGRIYEGDHRAELVLDGTAMGEAFAPERKDAADVGDALARAIGARCSCGRPDCLLAGQYAAGAIAAFALLVGKAVVRSSSGEPAVGVAAVLDELATLRGDVLAAVAAIVPTVTVNAASPANVDLLRDADGRVTGIRGAGS